MLTFTGGIPNIKFSANLINAKLDKLSFNKNIY